MAYDLCVKNKFFVLHINTSRNMHVMSIADQMRWVKAALALRDGHSKKLRIDVASSFVRSLAFSLVREENEEKKLC